jgi:hypothetical protein
VIVDRPVVGLRESFIDQFLVKDAMVKDTVLKNDSSSIAAVSAGPRGQT